MPVTSMTQGREGYQVWRKRHRIRLIDVAKYCNCSISLISQWENNLINISDKHVANYNKFIQELEDGKVQCG